MTEPIEYEYNQAGWGGPIVMYVGAVEWYAATFVAMSNHTIQSVTLQMWRLGTAAAYVSIRRVNPTTHVPVGPDLVSTYCSQGSISTVGDSDYSVVFDTPLVVTEGVEYAIVIHAVTTGSGFSNQLYVEGATSE